MKRYIRWLISGILLSVNMACEIRPLYERIKWLDPQIGDESSRIIYLVDEAGNSIYGGDCEDSDCLCYSDETECFDDTSAQALRAYLVSTDDGADLTL